MIKFIKVAIEIDDQDETRCAGRKSIGDSCPQIAKVSGTYACVLFNEEVDQGDDDNGDYVFKRCSQCISSVNEKNDNP